MGARPTGLVVGLGLPGDLTTEWVDALTDGLRDECALVGASVVGGDIARGEQIVLGVTALGDLAGRAPVTRSGARPGHVVAFAGRLGHAAAGLALLQAGIGLQRDDGPGEEFAVVVGAHRRPCPPYALGPQAADLGATAMLDVSDGLVQDLTHMAVASGVRIELIPGALAPAEPVRAAATRLGADPLDWILAGGEDHGLVAAFPSGVSLPGEWHVVGKVLPGEDGEPGVTLPGRTLGSGGWDHFQQ